MPKKWINLILSSIVFIIWIIIFYKLFFADDQSEADVSMHTSVTIKSVNDLSSYDSLAKSDPFRNPYNFHIKKPQPKIVRKQQIRQPLNIKVLGILTDEKGKLAIVEFANGESHFVRQGQTINDTKILRILENEVEVLFNKQRIKVSL